MKSWVRVSGLVFCLVGVIILSACRQRVPIPANPTATLIVEAATPTNSALELPFRNELPTRTPFKPQPTAEKQAMLWVDPGLPEKLRQSLKLPVGWVAADIDPATPVEPSAVRLSVGNQRPLSQWVYVLVAPFPTITDGVSFEELQGAWKGDQVGPFAGQPLLMDKSTRASFARLWGEPASQAILVVDSDSPQSAEQLLEYAWNNQPAWAMLPFEDLEPRWKVLEVDGISPLRKDFLLEQYPLVLPVSLMGDTGMLDLLWNTVGPDSTSPLVVKTNRDPDQLTVLAMTGTTALVRATAYTMEKKGVLYPAGDIRIWLRQADLVHVSNEAPFAEDCPFPNPGRENMRFCSDPRYITLLEDIGTNIVELTGDHIQDWGQEAIFYTLDLYRQKGWLVFGGGANLEEARRPVTVENHGNRLAFIGCNSKGADFAQAATDRAGAALCDLDWMSSQVSRLRQEGYLPVVTFQHFEYYLYEAQSVQVRDFRRMAEAGAVIVSGSQAHQPQGFDFTAGALIHYGLGNLFFDQYIVSKACRQVFIDRHVFYDGRYLGVDLLTAMFVDFARLRPMTSEERQDLLQTIFTASGW